MQLNKKHFNIKLLVNSILGIATILLVVLVYINRQYVADQMIVWSFKPAVDVVDLIKRAGMNDNGKFLYLASQPKLESAKDFNKSCGKTENTASILGCYSNGRIYIYNVTDIQLDGIREVTASHEVLHAVYARLGFAEKNKVDSLLDLEYQKLQSDVVFKEKIAFYDRTEIGQRNNELHSVIGTEIASISPELETYYSKYFYDRNQVIDLNTKYTAVFNVLQNKADQLKTKLDSLSVSIADMTSQYNADIQIINNDIQTFNNRANNGLFSSQSQFNSERLALSNRISALETLRNSINNQISEYNTILGEYNTIAIQYQALYKSIDSTLAPAPSI